jgi:hypothetical protein
MRTITSLIVAAIKSRKRSLTNSEIREYVQNRRYGTTAATIDTILTQASAKGIIEKTPTSVHGRAKNLYSVPKKVSVRKVVLASLTGSKMDSMQIHSVVCSVLPQARKKNVDQALLILSANGVINRSKNPMTDSNTISTQSKFLYSR